MTDIAISVVIPTYNRAEVLHESLRALANQSTDGFDYEVLFVDDGSDDDTPSILRQAVNDYPGRFRYLRSAHTRSPAAPRNIGMRMAQGPIIVLLDDDVVPDRDLLLEHWRFHQRHAEVTSAAVGELYLPEDVRADPMSLFHSFPYDDLRNKPRLKFYHFWSCNLSFKKAFMVESGMFDEDPVLYPVEDVECGYRLASRGLRLRFLPEARGQHLHKLQPSGIPGKGLRLGRAQFAITQRVPDPAIRQHLAVYLPGDRTFASYWRLLKRSVLWCVDNRVTLSILRKCGGTARRRTVLTDSYHYLVFRRNVLDGYRTAQKEDEQKLRQAPSQRLRAFGTE